MGRNEFKSEDKKAKKSSKKKNPRKINPFNKIGAFFSKIVTNEKLSKTIGLVLLTFSTFLLLAFSSFLFTWKVDQNIINNDWNDPNIQVENWLGKLGAYAGHQFIFNGFGVSAFLFVFLFFIVGFRVLFKSNILPLGKCFKYAIFSIVWISISLSYLVPSTPILGGAFGFQTNLWLSSIIGNIGILLFLALTVLLFLVINFNISFNFFLTKKENEGISENVFEESDLDVVTEIKEVEEEELINETSPLVTDETVESEEDKSINLSTTNTEEPKPINDENVEFVVEEVIEKDEILSDKEVDSKVKEFGEYDPTLDLSSYQLPSIDLLKDFGDSQKKVSPEELEENIRNFSKL